MTEQQKKEYLLDFINSHWNDHVAQAIDDGKLSDWYINKAISFDEDGEAEEWETYLKDDLSLDDLEALVAEIVELNNYAYHFIKYNDYDVEVKCYSLREYDKYKKESNDYYNK